MPAYCGYQVHGVKLAVVIIDELCAARYPLAVAFCPSRTLPSRCPPRRYAARRPAPCASRPPLLCGKRIIEIVQHHFRHAGSAGGEKHKHRSSPARAYRRNKSLHLPLRAAHQSSPSPRARRQAARGAQASGNPAMAASTCSRMFSSCAAIIILLRLHCCGTPHPSL